MSNTTFRKGGGVSSSLNVEVEQGREDWEIVKVWKVVQDTVTCIIEEGGTWLTHVSRIIILCNHICSSGGITKKV